MGTPGVSTGTVAELLVALGDNPDRIHSEAAFAWVADGDDPGRLRPWRVNLKGIILSLMTRKTI